MATAAKHYLTGKQLALEVEKKTGHKYDPGFLLNIRNGNRAHSTLGPMIDMLESKAAMKASESKPRPKAKGLTQQEGK